MDILEERFSPYPPQNCGIRFLKVHQVNRCFIPKIPGHQLDYSRIISSKLTFGLRYHKLVASFVFDIGDITEVSRQKTADLQFSPKCAMTRVHRRTLE